MEVNKKLTQAPIDGGGLITPDAKEDTFSKFNFRTYVFDQNQPVPDELLNGLKAFMQREINLSENSPAQLSAHKIDEQRYFLIQDMVSVTISAISRFLNSANTHRGVISVASDDSGIVGYSFGFVDSDGKKLIHTEFGISTEENYQRKKIASRLLTMRDCEFFREGFYEYETNVWSASKSLYDSLQIPYEISANGESLLVKLDNNSLQSACNKLNLDFNSTEQEVNIS